MALSRSRASTNAFRFRARAVPVAVAPDGRRAGHRGHCEDRNNGHYRAGTTAAAAPQSIRTRLATRASSPKSVRAIIRSFARLAASTLPLLVPCAGAHGAADTRDAAVNVGRDRVRHLPRKGQRPRGSIHSNEVPRRSHTLGRVRPAAEIAAARGVAALSRLARRGRRHDRAGKAPLEARPGRDRPAGGPAAGRDGRHLGDERQDDDRRDGGRDPAAALPAGPQPLRREPRLRGRLHPPRGRRRRARAARGGRGGPARGAPPGPPARRLPRQPLPRPARPLRRARARSPSAGATAVAALPGRDDARPERRRSAARARSADGRRLRPRRPAVARPALQHAADSKYCIRCGTPYDYAAAYVGHLGDYRCPNCGHARPPLEVVAPDVELAGLERASFDLVDARGHAPHRARAARASTTSTTRSAPRRSPAHSARRSTRSSTGSRASARRSDASSGSRSATSGSFFF